MFKSLHIPFSCEASALSDPMICNVYIVFVCSHLGDRIVGSCFSLPKLIVYSASVRPMQYGMY